MGNSGWKAAEEVNLAQQLTSQRAAAALVASGGPRTRVGSSRPLFLTSKTTCCGFYLLPSPALSPPPPLAADWQKSLSNPRLQTSSGDLRLVSWKDWGYRGGISLKAQGPGTWEGGEEPLISPRV